MKKSIFIVALAAVFTFTSCKENAADKVNEENVEQTSQAAANAASKSEEAPGKYPVMTFDKTEHDFGRIAQGTNVEHLFTFTNTGEAPLIISDAKGSCGCTVPTFTKEPVAPGDTGEMLVKFNGSGQNQRTISVNVSTNTQKGTERVSIKAFVEPKDGAKASGLSTNTSK
ncbi:DUF1573 domain-containing protein [uncultured Planktosalinus sp.]|uniref:DUF1573 domain-containing protein n=1 Tax=uncultured Planktosalinus sp. TaxID=1810935 RepID=UPI0030DDA403